MNFVKSILSCFKKNQKEEVDFLLEKAKDVQLIFLDICREDNIPLASYIYSKYQEKIDIYSVCYYYLSMKKSGKLITFSYLLTLFETPPDFNFLEEDVYVNACALDTIDFFTTLNRFVSSNEYLQKRIVKLAIRNGNFDLALYLDRYPKFRHSYLETNLRIVFDWCLDRYGSEIFKGVIDKCLDTYNYELFVWSVENEFIKISRDLLILCFQRKLYSLINYILEAENYELQNSEIHLVCYSAISYSVYKKYEKQINEYVEKELPFHFIRYNRYILSNYESIKFNFIKKYLSHSAILKFIDDYIIFKLTDQEKIILFDNACVNNSLEIVGKLRIKPDKLRMLSIINYGCYDIFMHLINIYPDLSLDFQYYLDCYGSDDPRIAKHIIYQGIYSLEGLFYNSFMYQNKQLIKFIITLNPSISIDYQGLLKILLNMRNRAKYVIKLISLFPQIEFEPEEYLTCFSHKVKYIKKLILFKSSIDLRFGDDYLFRFACRCQHYDTVKFLIGLYPEFYVIKVKGKIIINYNIAKYLNVIKEDIILPDEVCGICYENKINCLTDSCNHYFCYKCINIWYNTSETCPHCRGPISLVISN